MSKFKCVGLRGWLFALTGMLVVACTGKVQGPLAPRGTEADSAKTEVVPKMIRRQGTVSGNVEGELLDREGNIWFEASGEGVYRYDGKAFTNFTEADGLCSNDVSAILQDSAGNIVFGTKWGICKYDGKTFGPYPGLEDLEHPHVTSLLEDSKGNIWYGLMRGGIFRYDGKQSVNYLNSAKGEFNLGNTYQLILDMHEDRAGNLWFSSWNGGGVWKYDGKNFKNYVPSKYYYEMNEDGRQPAKPASLGLSYIPSPDYITDDMIFCISEDRAGNLWFGTRNHGACRYDGQHFYAVGRDAGFGDAAVYDILEDRKGNLWFTTEEKGVWRYDGKTYTNFTKEDGLANNSVFSVLEDREGNLWFGGRGFSLTRYDGKGFVRFSE